MKFHHIGIACVDLKKSIDTYKNLGYSNSDIIYDPLQKVNLCFLNKANSPLIELVGSDENNSVLNNILKKNGTSPYHTCYEINNINNQINSLIDKDYVLIMKPIKAIAFSNRKICFMYHRHIGVIELLEC